MAKSVLDAIARFDEFEKQLVKEMPAISKDVSAMFLRLKIQQIRKQGIGKYSSKLYSARYLRGKELNGLGRTFLKNKIKAKQLTNWAELRKAQGLQVGFVDVSYSGQMLNSTVILEAGNQNIYKFVVTIGGRNEESRKKLSHNRKRYGNFLYPTKDQDKAIKERVNFLIGRLYKRVVLNAA